MGQRVPLLRYGDNKTAEGKHDYTPVVVGLCRLNQVDP
jgi:hypothetical protein